MATYSLSGVLSAMRAKTGTYTTTSALTWAFLATVGVLVTLWYAVTPYYSDDLVYAGALMGASPETLYSRLGTCGNYPLDFAWWWTQVKEISHTTSPRLLDLMVVPMLWLPKLVVDCISGITFAVALWFIGRTLNYLNPNGLTRISALTLALLLFLPWEGDMTCFTYSKNYVWTLALIAWMVYLLFKREQRPSVAMLCALGFLLGWIHEMAGLAVCGACTVDCMWKRDRRMLWTAIATFVPSIVILMMGFVNRHEGGLSSPSQLFWGFRPEVKYLVFFWAGNAPWLLLGCAASLVAGCRKKLRDRIDRMWIWLLVAAVGAGLEGGAVAFLGDRVMWYCAFFSIVLCFHIVNQLRPQPLIKSAMVNQALFCIIFLAIGVNLVTGSVITYRMAQEERIVEQDFVPNPSVGRFYTMTAVNRPSILAFNRLAYYDQARHVDSWNRLTAFAIHGLDCEKMPLPIPAALRDITVDKAWKVPGPNPCYQYHGWLAAPSVIAKNHEWVAVRYSWHRTFYRHMYCTPFTAEDGSQWTFIDFEGTDNYSRFSRITEILF